MIEQIFLLMWAADIAAITRLLCSLLVGVGGGAAVLCLLIAADSRDPDVAPYLRRARQLVTFAAVMALVAILVPTKTTIYTYLALSVGVEVAEISGLNETAGKAVRLLNQKLDAELEADENR